MKIYNTLTREKQEFIPIKQGEVKIYQCGPTVYNFMHIGNARPLCVFDTLRRYMEYKGLKVTFVQNFTDVDDKIIKKANEEGSTADEVAKRYIAEYQTDAKGLNVKDATFYPKVTENIDNIIDVIITLINKGNAYESNGDVYFRAHSFKEYGKLSRMPLEDLEAGARVDVSDQKESPVDFALWKKAKQGEPSWPSPWGEGRPGWHIECSAMSKTILGNTIDIHCGGQDLIFPHHENEIAQSECANSEPLANYWMHNGYINVDNKKMSKSLNNFFITREVANKYGYDTVRYMMIAAHYRSPINYTDEVITQCKSSLERINNCKEMLTFSISNSPEGEITEEQQNSIDSYKDKFMQAMEDDLNTADALSYVFELVREANIAVKKGSGKGYYKSLLTAINELTDILGILYEVKEESIPQEILDLVEERKNARKDKNFALADEIRDRIVTLGYMVEETRQGVKITKLG